jgi:hypothetical protein
LCRTIAKRAVITRTISQRAEAIQRTRNDGEAQKYANRIHHFHIVAVVVLSVNIDFAIWCGKPQWQVSSPTD